MATDITSPSAQLNIYKFEEMSNKLLPLQHSSSKFQTNLALSILQDLSWTQPRKSLINYWAEKYKPPLAPSKCFSVLQYNIQYFYSNQCDLVDMVSEYSPTIISLNELGTTIPPKIIQNILFSYNIFYQIGTNAHGGVVLAIDKKLKAVPLNIVNPNVVAALVYVKDDPVVIASVYSPPTESLPITAMSSLMQFSKNVIIAGDLNAKHADWGCPQINTKGRQLSEWLLANELGILNAGTRTSLRSNTTIDLIIASYPPDTTRSTTLPYTGSDHLPVLTEFPSIDTSDDHVLVPKTYWNVYTAVLAAMQDQIDDDRKTADWDAESTFDWFIDLQSFLHALKLRVTVWQTVKQRRPTLSPSLRILLQHKHYLQNRYRHTRFEDDRLRLRSWCKLVQREFFSMRQKRWNLFISNVASSNPGQFWKTVKIINKKGSVQFAAITEATTIHRSKATIVKCLGEHFSHRLSAPMLDPNNKLDNEATANWNLYRDADPGDIELACSKSDLNFVEWPI